MILPQIGEKIKPLPDISPPSTPRTQRKSKSIEAAVYENCFDPYGPFSSDATKGAENVQGTRKDYFCS